MTVSWRDYLALTKPRIVVMVGIVTTVGFFYGSPGTIAWGVLAWTVLGTAFVGAGTNALNQLAEWPHDAKMNRTRNRPLPAGRMTPDQVFRFSWTISLLGIFLLGAFAHWISALLAVVTLGAYVFIYTPLKRKTSLNTLVGAIPGAIPPMGGYAAATGHLDPAAWILFGLLFLWQFPHFLAIAWMYREDYARGGYRMLPGEALLEGATGRQALVYCLALMPMSLLPTLLGMAGGGYFWGACALGAVYLLPTCWFAANETEKAARRVVLASVVYLPALFALLVLDQWIR